MYWSDGTMYEVLMDGEEENEDDVGMKMVRMFGRCIGQDWLTDGDGAMYEALMDVEEEDVRQ